LPPYDDPIGEDDRVNLMGRVEAGIERRIIAVQRRSRFATLAGGHYTACSAAGSRRRSPTTAFAVFALMTAYSIFEAISRTTTR
jgi:hypothetical protein